MKKLVKIQLAILIAIFFSATSFAQVTSDYDKSIDFTKYKTYAFAGWQKGSDKILNDLDKGRLQDAFKEEFSKRNMTLVTENPDAYVTLYLVIDNKTSTTAYTDYNGGMGMGVRGAAWGWGMGSSTTTYSEDDYKEGTLVVDVYDGTTKKLAWQGTSQSTVQAKASKREKTIPKKVSKLMAKYPIEAEKK